MKDLGLLSFFYFFNKKKGRWNEIKNLGVLLILQCQLTAFLKATSPHLCYWHVLKKHLQECDIAKN